MKVNTIISAIWLMFQS